jgi:hypothetical protein
MIEFATFTPQEESHVQRIIAAQRGLIAKHGTGQVPDLLTLRMDLAAAHAEHPLQLDLLAAESEPPTFDFIHDVLGIFRYMDRETGKLRECFVPRFSR